MHHNAIKESLMALEGPQKIVIWDVAGHLTILIVVDRPLKNTRVIVWTSNTPRGSKLKNNMNTWMKRDTLDITTTCMDCFMHP